MGATATAGAKYLFGKEWCPALVWGLGTIAAIAILTAKPTATE
jgi:hypothetical protein